jgi:hypothetical protein
MTEAKHPYVLEDIAPERNTFYVGLTCPECHAAEAMADR